MVYLLLIKFPRSSPHNSTKQKTTIDKCSLLHCVGDDEWWILSIALIYPESWSNHSEVSYWVVSTRFCILFSTLFMLSQLFCLHCTLRVWLFCLHVCVPRGNEWILSSMHVLCMKPIYTSHQTCGLQTQWVTCYTEQVFNYNQLQVYAKLRQGIYASWAANAVSEIHCLLSAFSLLFIFLQLF